MSTLDSATAAYITDEINIRYFSGFAKSEGALIVTCDSAVLLVDFRYIEAAREKCNGICRVALCSDKSKYLADFCKSCAISRVLLEDESVTLRQLYNLQTAVPNVRFITDRTLFDNIKKLRIIKDASELESLKAAQRIAEKSYLELLNHLRAGVSEKSLSTELEYLMKKNGAEDIAFDLITIAGSNTSKPHGVPSDYIVQNGDFVTFDIGAVFDGYHSDMTRTVAVGYADDEMRRIYDIVKSAQSAALNKVRDGESARVCDAAARDIIKDEGFGDNFGHATGHGVGLQIHEYPVLAPSSGEILEEGMVVTVEPGIYLPDKFGVRIEDTVCVTESGCDNFAEIGKNLIII